jgi:formylglycine-generating enzyme required for sulfatase activity
MKAALIARSYLPCLYKVFVALTMTFGVCFATCFAAAPPAIPGLQPVRQSDKSASDLVELFQSDQDITNSIGMVLVSIPAGYRVARHEVTQAEYQKVMRENPSRFEGAQRPVEQVSWNRAREFCQKLTESERAAGSLPDGYTYGLPTETQWSFFVGDAELGAAITSHLGDRRQTEPVGALSPNQYGLYDVRGNVWEWCAEPVARGASWRSHEDYLAVDFRYVGTADAVYDDVGFRVILQPVDDAAAR